MGKIKLERMTESLSVPGFYIAYTELGQKYNLFGKHLDELVDFFGDLSRRDLRRIFAAFGLQAIVDDDYQVAFYVGGRPGLLVAKREVPPEARQPGGYSYECPHSGRPVHGGFLDHCAVAALAGLYVDPARVKQLFAELMMVQPLEVCFPYSGKKQWHEDDILRIAAESVIAGKLGLPDVVSSGQLTEVADRLANDLGFDIDKWAETRARNIRQGIEAVPSFFAYKRVDKEDNHEGI